MKSPSRNHTEPSSNADFSSGSDNLQSELDGRTPVASGSEEGGQERSDTPPKTSESARAKLTIKQRKFIDGKLRGKSSLRAALDAGYSDSVSRHANRIISESSKVQAAIDEILQAAGIDEMYLATRMKEGLDATFIHFPTKYSKREVCIDFRERREMIELVLRLKGYLGHEHRVDVRGPTLEEILERSYEIGQWEN